LSVSLRETHQAQTLINVANSCPEYVVVNSIAGLSRGMHVRVRVSPNVFEHRVVSAVDADSGRLYWVNPNQSSRLPNELPLTGYDASAATSVESVEYTLLVREGARVIAVYDGLSLSPSHPRYGPKLLSGIATWEPGRAQMQLPDAPQPLQILESRTPSDVAMLTPLAAPLTSWISLIGGADGLSALTIKDFIGQPANAWLGDAEALRRCRGIAALADLDEPALIAIPDIHIQPDYPPEKRPLAPCVPDPCLPMPPFEDLVILSPEPLGDLPPRFSDADVYLAQAALVNHCELRRDRVALLDPPYSAVRDTRLGIAMVRAWRKRFDSKYAAMYFPWLKVADPLRTSGNLLRLIPPSGHIAGFCAKTDIESGVHKAPANGALTWVLDLSMTVEDVAHGLLNDEGVNVVRAYPSRGIRICGARTVSSDPDWRYLNVRRLMMMIEKSLGVATQWAVFEPNDFRTRAKLYLSFTSFLMTLWQRGALAGPAPADAFFVRCDEANNPPDQRARGELLAEIGVAPSKPFEFVVLRVGRADNQFEISERVLEGGFA
jgi:hypothetical protein